MLVPAWGTLGSWKHEPADLQISAAGKKGLPCTIQAAFTEGQLSDFPLKGGGADAGDSAAAGQGPVDRREIDMQSRDI